LGYPAGFGDYLGGGDLVESRGKVYVKTLGTIGTSQHELWNLPAEWSS
jgi:hypothetical protein